MLLGAVGLFLVIRHYGRMMAAPDRPVSEHLAPASGVANDTLLHVLLALAAVVIVGRLLGRVLAMVGQPPVIGEVLGGIFLGPSLLGRIAPDISDFVLPDAVAPYLGIVAQLGVILYMFLVGIELRGDALRRRARVAVATSHASIVTPFILGAALSLVLYPRLSSSDVPFTSFALFMGVAMSITAFPVLARILTDRGMHRTELGVIALACAAADDVTAWCLLAFVVGITQSAVGRAVYAMVMTAGFIAVMFYVVRPAVERVITRAAAKEPGGDAIAIALVGVVLCAVVTEAIGIHAIFGAFLFGAVIPHDSRLAGALKAKLEDLVTILLLPAFFAFTGMRTEIGLVTGTAALAMCAAIVLVATVGKFGGTLVAARLTGLGWRDAASLGVLMNTRGLMELIVLNIGLDLGVISPTLFTMMVLMAIITTIATTPALYLLLPALRSARGAVTSNARTAEGV